MRYKEYSKTQLESNANELNDRFDKERLEKAKPIDVYDVLEFIDADVDWKYLSKDQSVLGATVFCDGMLPVFEKENGIFEEKNIFVNAGTIIIDIGLDESSNVGRKNFTVMHEVFHFFVSQEKFYKEKWWFEKSIGNRYFSKL